MTGWQLIALLVPRFYPMPAMIFISFDDSWLDVEIRWLWFSRRRKFKAVGTGWRREDGKEFCPIPEAMALTVLVSEQRKGPGEDR